MRRRFLVAVVCLAFLAAAAIKVCQWFDLGHDPVEKVERLHGQSLDEVVTELGAPTHFDEFPMRDSAGEFRVGLLNVYPPSDPTSADVIIKELSWEYPRYSLTVWFHQVGDRWVGLNTCRWRKGVVF